MRQSAYGLMKCGAIVLPEPRSTNSCGECVPATFRRRSTSNRVPSSVRWTSVNKPQYTRRLHSVASAKTTGMPSPVPFALSHRRCAVTHRLPSSKGSICSSLAVGEGAYRRRWCRRRTPSTTVPSSAALLAWPFSHSVPMSHLRDLAKVKLEVARADVPPTRVTTTVTSGARARIPLINRSSNGRDTPSSRLVQYGLISRHSTRFRPAMISRRNSHLIVVVSFCIVRSAV